MRIKRWIMGTTAIAGAALMLTSAPSPAQAQLELSISGFSRFLVPFAEEDRVSGDNFADPSGGSDDGYNFELEARPRLNIQGTTDGGLIYGGVIEFQASTWDTNTTRQAWLYFSGAFGRIEMGNLDGAADQMNFGAHTVNTGTGGANGLFPRVVRDVKIIDSDKASKITYYTPRVAGFQAGASFTPNTRSYRTRRPDDLGPGFKNHVEVGLNWTGNFGGASLGLAGTGSFGDNQVAGADDLSAWAVGGQVGFGGARVAAMYGNERPGRAGAAQGVGGRDRLYIVQGVMNLGPADVGLGYYERDPSNGDSERLYVGSATFALVPGVRLQGDLGYNDIQNGPDYWSGIAAVRLDF